MKQVTAQELTAQIPFKADYHRAGLYQMYLAAGLPVPQHLHQFPVPEARQINRKDQE